MSNRLTSFKPTIPTRRVGAVPSPEIKNPTGGANAATSSTNLASIVPKRFVKAVPPRSRILDTNPDRSSPSSTFQDESATGSEEGSASIENEASSLSESEQSAEKIQSNANSEQNVPLNTEQTSTRGAQAATPTPWQPTITKHRKKLNALKEKREKASSQRLERKKAQILPQELKSSLGFSRNLEFQSNATEFDHPLVLSSNSNQHDLAQKNKKPLFSLIPKRLFKALKEAISTEADEPLVNDEITDANARQAFGKSLASTLKSLHKSDLYKEALPDNEHLATLRPLVLEKYLSSLLKDAGARETIEKHKLNADEVAAIRWYGREGFQYVQPSLRKKPDPGLGEDNVVAPPGTFKYLVKACERGFAKLPPLPPGTELFRGTNFLFDDNLKPGDVFTDPAFVSTSTSKAVAEQKFSGVFLLKFINIPEGDPSWRDISSLTGNSKEAEVLCLPGKSFRVVSRGEGAEQGAGTIDNPEIITLEPISVN